MSDEKTSKPLADDLAKDLKASLATRRPSIFLPVLIAIVICSAILGGLFLYFYPRGRTPPLMVIAFDAIYTPDETPSARAQLFSSEQDGANVRLRGHSVVFDDQGEKSPIATSDDKGQAAVDWPIEKVEFAPFFAQWQNRERREASAKELGRLYIWPKGASILLVDADEALLADGVNEKAHETLAKAASEGWHIAYLALAASGPHEFRKAHAQIEEQVKLPKGPILARSHYPSDDTHESAQRTAIEAIKSKFTGPLTVVVKSKEAAAACKDLGVRVVRIGDADTPTWGEVRLK